MLCPWCRQEFEAPVEGMCPNCGEFIEVVEEPGEGEAPPPPLPPGQGPACPFEDTSLPFWDRLWGTIRLVFLDPRALFSNLPEGDIGLPLLYGVIVTSIGMVGAYAWNLMFQAPMYMIDGGSRGEALIGAWLYAVLILLSPLFAAMGLFLGSAIYHLMLLLVGDGEKGFNTTFRVVCYAATVQVLGIVPLCGGLVGGIWNMVLTIWGAILGHRTEPWKAVLAYFLPIIVCCCIPLMFVLMLGGFAGILESLNR